ncbi:MAG: cyclic nucleotide-binding domain-containing protein [Zetaproteobacteria bacterium CG_4_9_14_3_um_filter_53_7]|nr:MAG: cyclic nucleotide-binding domain-containing protein [Zetaproteobacteria bacterium CG_4_9_14_3_um_filter_53_7]
MGALNNFVLNFFSTQRQKRAFSFAYNIKHLTCVILAAHPCPAGYSDIFRVSLDKFLFPTGKCHSSVACIMSDRNISASSNEKSQLKVYADLVHLYPENEAYIRQYAELLLDDGQLSSATEILRHLHQLLLKQGEAGKADSLARQFPQIGRIKNSDSPRREDMTRLLPSGMRNRLWLKLHQKRVGEGRHLFRRGEIEDTLYLVCEGELAEFIKGANGKPVLLNLIQAGDVVGESNLLVPGAHKTDVVANKNSIVAKLPRSKMVAALDNLPSLKAALQRKADFRRMTALISSCPLLENIPLDMRQHLAEESFIRQYPAGTNIHTSGDKLNYVDLIVRGEACFQLQNNQSLKELKSLPPGSLIGDTAAIQDGGCPADMRATAALAIVHIPCDAFKTVVEAYPPLRNALFANAAKQQAQLMSKLNEFQTQQI